MKEEPTDERRLSCHNIIPLSASLLLYSVFGGRKLNAKKEESFWRPVICSCAHTHHGFPLLSPRENSPFPPARFPWLFLSLLCGKPGPSFLSKSLHALFFLFSPAKTMYEGRTGIIDQFLPQEMWEGIISPLSFSYSPLQTDFCASKRGGRGRFFSVFFADTRSQTSVHCLIQYTNAPFLHIYYTTLHLPDWRAKKNYGPFWNQSYVLRTAEARVARVYCPLGPTDHRLTEVENLKYGFYFPPPPPPPPKKRSGFRYCTRNSDCRVIDGCDTIRHWVCVEGRLLLVFGYSHLGSLIMGRLN